MKKIFYFIASALLLGMTGCSNEELAEAPAAEQGKGKVINLTLNATRGDAGETRTAVSYNSEYGSLESAWKAGDKVYVYSRKSGAQIGTLDIDAATIVNEKTSATAQYATSYASFKGDVTISGDDKITDTYAFVYQGEGRSLSVDADGMLTYEIGTSNDIDGLSAWDVAYASGQVQGTTDGTDAKIAVSFANKLAFAYFSTEGLSGTELATDYYNQFTLDVKTGTVKGVGTGAKVPADKKFYMALVPAAINIKLSKAWSQQGGKYGYSGGELTKPFTAAAGTYYRLSKNNTDPFGAVPFIPTTWKKYNTLEGSKFDVAADKKVYFTQGNLQYVGSAATPYWRVADSQYDYFGTGNGIATNAESGATIDATADVDLFGWGSVDVPFLGSNDNTDYAWGITAANQELPADHNWSTKFNGGTTLYASDSQTAYGTAAQAGSSYCVLSKAEWQYLFANQYWGFATVSLTNGGTVNGLVICPNSITTEEEAKAVLGSSAIVYKSNATQTGKTAAFSENMIDQATIDNNGLLFLPVAGRRDGTSITGADGSYWSTTSSGATGAYNVSFNATRFYFALGLGRCYGFSVRLASVASE